MPVKQMPAGCAKSRSRCKTRRAFTSLPPATPSCSRGVARILGPEPQGPRQPVSRISTPSGASSRSSFKQPSAPSPVQLEDVHTKTVALGAASLTSASATTPAAAAPPAGPDAFRKHRFSERGAPGAGAGPRKAGRPAKPTATMATIAATANPEAAARCNNEPTLRPLPPRHRRPSWGAPSAMPRHTCARARQKATAARAARVGAA
mmetsp:Transcript_12739/g.45110  ORF Transcript_12739/g.45110 Transcript_12739/m.45110 type:complete len:206 (+) Transcript_12739:328-945(+)